MRRRTRFGVFHERGCEKIKLPEIPFIVIAGDVFALDSACISLTRQERQHQMNLTANANGRGDAQRHAPVDAGPGDPGIATAQPTGACLEAHEG